MQLTLTNIIILSSATFALMKTAFDSLGHTDRKEKEKAIFDAFEDFFGYRIEAIKEKNPTLFRLFRRHINDNIKQYPLMTKEDGIDLAKEYFFSLINMEFQTYLSTASTGSIISFHRAKTDYIKLLAKRDPLSVYNQFVAKDKIQHDETTTRLRLLGKIDMIDKAHQLLWRNMLNVMGSEAQDPISEKNHQEALHFHQQLKANIKQKYPSLYRKEKIREDITNAVDSYIAYQEALAKQPDDMIAAIIKASAEDERLPEAW